MVEADADRFGLRGPASRPGRHTPRLDGDEDGVEDIEGIFLAPIESLHGGLDLRERENGDAGGCGISLR